LARAPAIRHQAAVASIAKAAEHRPCEKQAKKTEAEAQLAVDRDTFRASWNGVGSIVASKSPFFTVWLSTTLMLTIRPLM